MSIIEIQNATFRYNEKETEALKDVSLTIEKGEFVVVLGENGSGKSTLSKMINGLLLPESGKVIVDGYDTANKSTIFDLRKKVGMVFQNPDNQMVATIVEDDIAFAPENIGLDSEEIGRRIDFALTATDMQEFRFYQGQKLSGGQKQRIAIAGVLAMKPDILILDESTAMLDPKGRKEVMEIVKKLNNEGMTVICITHYMEEAISADKVVVMHKGEIVKRGKPQDIFSIGSGVEAFGLTLPRAVYIANELIKNGLPIKNGILDEEELTGELCKLFQKA